MVIGGGFSLASAVVLLMVLAESHGNDITLDRGFTKEQKQNLIDLHNYYRARVARGEEPNQPKAADMVAMEWDDRLVKSAQSWSGTCRGWHNRNEQRRFQPYPFTGQNYAGNMGMTESVRAWYDEVTEGHFRFQGSGCSSVCGHYTQVVWSKSHLVGCAQSKCASYGDDKSNVYCEYAPGGNTQWKGRKDPVYTVGEPCSKCPSGFGFCMGGSLCASKRACSNTDSECKCTISSCQNGGSFDPDSCSCKCKPGFEGVACDQKCKDNIDFCDQYKNECAWNAQMWMWMGRDCRKTCGKCGAPKDSGLSNRDAIKTNVKDMTPEIDCKNDANDASCDLWIDQCKTNPSFMKKKCRRACRFCKSMQGDVVDQTEDRKTNDKNLTCQNKYNSANCDSWAARGECEANPGWMLVNCARSCECKN